MEHDHMIEALAPNGTNHPLHIGSLPRGARRRQHFADAHVSDMPAKCITEDSIAVAQQVARELVKGKGFPQLLSCPLGGRVGGYIEVENAPAVMSQHQKHVKHLEANSRHGKEIDGDQLLGVILQESSPILRPRLVAVHHIFADAAFTDVDAELEQFTMDEKCAPTGGVWAHPADQ